MKKLLFILALLCVPSICWAQCTGVFPPKTICGNLSSVPAPPSAFPSSGSVVGPTSSTPGDVATWANNTGSLLADTPALQIFGTQSTNTIFAGPGSGSAAFPTFRMLVDSDLPSNVVIGGGVNVQSSSYTIATSDCNGAVVESGAFQTLTLPSTSGFPTSCTVKVINSNTSRAQKLANFPGNLGAYYTPCGSACLWPQQSVCVQVVSGAWLTCSNPGLWRWQTGFSFMADITNGSDATDCLGTTTGACKTIQQAVNLALRAVDANGNQPSILVADGIGYVPFTVIGQPHGSNCISITGNTASPGNVLIEDNAVTQTIIWVQDFGCVQLDGMAVRATIDGDIGVGTRQFSIADLRHFQIQNMGVGVGVDAAEISSINVDGPFSVVDSVGGSGSSVSELFSVSVNSKITFGSSLTIPISGTWAITDSCVAASGGVIDLESSTFSGGTVTGTKFVANTAGGIINGAANCPGSTSGTTTSPGYSN